MTPAGNSSFFIAALFYLASIWAAHAENGFSGVREHHHHGGNHHHDGTYAVDITTRHGDCDKHSHWTILVSGGRVSSAGNTPMNASGHINSHGHVHLTFKRFHHIATITGTLTTGAGSGTWHSPSLECSGSWHAHRRT